MKTLFEPFKIKMVEAIRKTTVSQRIKILEAAHFNPFLIRADDVMIDFLTDSGTGSMSDQQWAAIMVGDEAYAGSKSYYHFRDTVQDITGFKHIIPTHQGRAAEHILFACVVQAGDHVPNNTHFDTTRANIEYAEAVAVDLPIPEGLKPSANLPFKGNIDLDQLNDLLVSPPGKIPLGMITVTNNAEGGQPVSMENIRETSAVLKENGIPFFLDACRFAENAYFIQRDEPGYQDKSIDEICREMFSYADGCTMSAKKDGMVNIGGFLAVNDDDLATKARNLLVLTEGFPSYGGLAGRDLEALAVGLREAMQDDYLEYRIRTVAYMGERLLSKGIEIVQPTGGHAIFIDAQYFYPHIPKTSFPGQVLACDLYRRGGVRCVEIGSVMFGKQEPDGSERPYEGPELVRLAFPRRTYTQSHFDYAIETIIQAFENRDQAQGLHITRQTKFLRHFTAHFGLSQS
ncbi:MAG: tryptophanase [Saprospiraceae bacterium]|nr:tryptophanase [Saprospiraceae bacterium]